MINSFTTDNMRGLVFLRENIQSGIPASRVPKIRDRNYFLLERLWALWFCGIGRRLDRVSWTENLNHRFRS